MFVEKRMGVTVPETTAVEAGVDVDEAEALRAEAAAHLADASAGVVGVADEVLTVTPASWNEGRTRFRQTGPPRRRNWPTAAARSWY